MNKAEFDQAKLFMFSDISREIAMAHASQSFIKRILMKLSSIPPGSGNFMAALALLSYTEFAGRLKNNDFSDTNSGRNFNSFFCDLGTNYQTFLSNHNVYKIFRCGLAHVYYVKLDCTIYITQKTGNKPGIGYDGSKYFFILETYFQDFKKAFISLENVLFP